MFENLSQTSRNATAFLRRKLINKNKKLEFLVFLKKKKKTVKVSTLQFPLGNLQLQYNQ